MKLNTFLMGFVMGISACQVLPVTEKTISKEQLQAVGNDGFADTLYQAPSDYLHYMIVIDSIICHYSRPQQGKKVLQLFDMNMQLLREFVEKGTGADQMLMAAMYHGSGKVVLRDPVLKKIMVVDVCRAVSDTSYHPRMFKSDFFSQRVIPYGKRLLFLNPYSYNGQEPRVLVTDRKWRYEPRRHKGHLFWAGNYVLGDIVLNDKTNQIAYCAEYEPRMELMDKEGRLKTIVTLPHKKAVVNEISHDGIIEPVVQYPGVDCFLSADGNEDCLVASFWTDEEESLVLKLDWNGNLLDGFRTSGKTVKLSVENDGIVYVWEKEGETERLLQIVWK